MNLNLVISHFYFQYLRDVDEQYCNWQWPYFSFSSFGLKQGSTDKPITEEHSSFLAGLKEMKIFYSL